MFHHLFCPETFDSIISIDIHCHLKTKLTFFFYGMKIRVIFKLISTCFHKHFCIFEIKIKKKKLNTTLFFHVLEQELHEKKKILKFKTFGDNFFFLRYINRVVVEVVRYFKQEKLNAVGEYTR